jgi:hypothetical protein
MKVGSGSNLPVPEASAGRSANVKGFRTPASHWREGMHGGRKASREETAGEFAPTLVSIYGEFAAAA